MLSNLYSYNLSISASVIELMIEYSMFCLNLHLDKILLFITKIIK
jgi:hypothetical protein